MPVFQTALFFRSLDLDVQLHVFRHACGNQVIRSPLGAVDGGGKIAVADFHFLHRVLIAVEFAGFEDNRMGLSEQGQVALNRAYFFAVKDEFGGGKTDFGIFLGVENIGRFQVFGKFVAARLQVGQRQYGFDGTGFLRGVEMDIAGNFVNAADVGAGAEMVDFEAGLSNFGNTNHLWQNMNR